MKHMTPEACRGEIRAAQSQIDDLERDINAIAQAHIPDFHFLNHKVSTFWTCATSPIGMCVFLLEEGRFHLDCVCRYCGDPVERK